MSCLSWRRTGACVTVVSTRLANGALRRRHRVLLERGSTAVLGGLGMPSGYVSGVFTAPRAPKKSEIWYGVGSSIAAPDHGLCSMPSPWLPSSCHALATTRASRAPDASPSQEVIHAAVSDKLETLLQVG